jgi:hypothetical protein
MVSAITLIPVTAFRTIMGLIMGLAIQLALLQPLLSADSVSDRCAAAGCCDEMASCPCASNGDPEQKPAPIAPAQLDSKLSPPKARELDLLPLLIPPDTSEAVVAAASIPESHVGFAGVPLSVAFCTFVI